MVEAIGAAIIAGIGAEAAIGTTAIIAGITVNTVIGTTVVLGGTIALQSLLAPDVKQKVASQQFSSRQALPPRRRAYGIVKLAGPYVAFDAVGGAFFTGTYLVEGPIYGFLGYWLDDKQAALPAYSLGGPAGVLPWVSAVAVEGHTGTIPQAASPLLSALGYWDASYRLDGCAYVAMRAVPPPDPAKNFRRVYPSGSWPQVRALIQASLVRNILDPSSTSDPSTWQWSDNPALCIRDHLTHQTWGLKVPEELIDDTSFAEAALMQSQLITTKDGTVIGRYTIGGAFDLTDEPVTALQGMLDACDGRLYLTPEGKIGFAGGAYVAPDVTLTDPNIISATIEAGNGKRASFNRLKISYVSPLHDYQQIEGDPWEDLDAQEAAGEILEQDFARPWVHHHNQVRRLAKIYMARMNPRWRISMITDRSGLPALFEDVIHLQLTRYGIDAVFEVQRAVLSADGATCQFDLTSIDPAAYTFDAAAEEGQEPLPPHLEIDEGPPDPPDNLTVSVEQRPVSGGYNAAFLRLTSDAPDRTDLSLIGRYRISGDPNWIDMVRDGDDPYSLTSGVLNDGAEYEVEGALATYGRASLSSYVDADPATILATADTTSPGPPTGFAATGGAGQYSFAFTAPNSPNYRSSRLYRGTTSTFGSASPVGSVFYGAGGQSFDRVDTIGAGTYYLWVRSFNGSGFGDASSTAGPISVTVT